MVHRGEILQKAIRESGMPVTRVARAVHKSRRWIYNQFERPDVPLDFLIEIGRVIYYDFSPEIPELRRNKSASPPKPKSTLRDPETPYPDNNARYWKDKYLKLLEEHTELLKTLKKRQFPRKRAK